MSGCLSSRRSEFTAASATQTVLSFCANSPLAAIPLQKKAATPHKNATWPALKYYEFIPFD